MNPVINQPTTVMHQPRKKGLYQTLNERFGLQALNYEVPAHANTLPFTLGGITAVSTLLTIVSGILLGLWFVPTPEAANSSIRVITESVYMGSVIRGIHYWSAQLTVGTLVLHLLRVFVYGSYKKPREGNWILGVFLFAIMIGLYFTGTTLKWDQEGFEALEHAQTIAATFGAGGLLNPANVPVITRLFIAHISLLPLILLVLLFVHMLLIKRLKISPLPWKKDTLDSNTEAGKEHRFGHHFRSLIGYGYVIFGIVMIFAVLAPPAIGPVPLTGIEVTKPLWPFLWIYAVEAWFGINGAIVFSGLLFAGLLVVPFLDRGTDQSFGKRKWILFAGLAVTVIMLVLTLYGYYSGPVEHLKM